MDSFADTGDTTMSASISRTGYSFNTIEMHKGTVEELTELLEQKVLPRAEIYKNSPVVIDAANINYLKDLDYDQLAATCRNYGLFLIGISGILTEERADTLIKRNIPVVNSTKFARMREENFKPRVITKTIEIQVPVLIPEPYEVKVPYEVRKPEPMMVVSHSLRSGECISAPDTSVLILGNVARTARIIASHNVFVFGDMHGEVYAGSPKDKDTDGYEKGIIYVSGVFAPTLVAIAGNYQTADDMENNQTLKSLYGEDSSVIVSLNGRSLNYCHVKDVQTIQSRF